MQPVAGHPIPGGEQEKSLGPQKSPLFTGKALCLREKPFVYEKNQLRPRKTK
jgi:hypothetical protein